MSFAIGQTEFEHSSSVCANSMLFPVAGIFGQDVICTQGIDIISSRASIMLNGEELPIINWSSPKKESARDAQSEGNSSTPVFLMEERIIPSLSEVLATATLSVDTFQKQEGVIERRELYRQGLLGADVLVHVDSEGKVPIRAANLSLKTLHLPKNKIVADFVAATPREMAEDEGSML